MCRPANICSGVRFRIGCAPLQQLWMAAELICWLEAQGTEHNRAEKFSDRGNGGHVIEHGQLERGEAGGEAADARSENRGA